MIETNEILIRLLLAAFLGALIGMERERKDWSAGTRTHMLVGVGASLFMIVSAFGFKDILDYQNVNLDPSRVAAQVVSGIGFIGAGAILFLKQGTVRGLTTAAGLWTVAAIGLATGGGMYIAAIATTIIALLILWAMQPLQHMYSKKFKQVTLKIVTDSHLKNLKVLEEFKNDKTLKVLSYIIEQKKDHYSFTIRLRNVEEDRITDIITSIESHPEIVEFTWMQ